MSSTSRCCFAGGGHRETEEAWAARAGTPFSFSFLGAPGGKVFLAVADAALHDVAVPVLGILSSTKTFSAAVGPLTFSFPVEVSEGVVLCPKERTTSPFSFPLSAALVAEMFDHPSKPADGFVREPPPFPLCSAVLEVDVFCCFCLAHVL